jgi:hypothetical protein
MAVIRPVRLVIDNYPAGRQETFTIENNPERPEDGRREFLSRVSSGLRPMTLWKSRPRVFPTFSGQ